MIEMMVNNVMMTMIIMTVKFSTSLDDLFALSTL